MTGIRGGSGRPGGLAGSTGGNVAAAALLLAALGAPAAAAEPKGCAAFKWPLDQEAARLQAAADAKPQVKSEANPDAKPDGTAYALALVPLAEAHLALPPERKPRIDPSTAGALGFAAPRDAGAYQVAVSVAAWIDVVQGGRIVHPTGFSGATDCPGVRKSIRFPLAAEPFTIQLSGTDAAAAALLVEPVP